MDTINVAEAKAQLSELVERAAAGEIVSITRRGVPRARLVAADPARQPIDADELARFTAQMPRQEIPAGEFVRAMREGARY